MLSSIINEAASGREMTEIEARSPPVFSKEITTPEAIFQAWDEFIKGKKKKEDVIDKKILFYIMAIEEIAFSFEKPISYSHSSIIFFELKTKPKA